MEISESQLKQILFNFNQIVNRLFKTDYPEYNHILTKFLDHIRSTELIYSYVKNCSKQEFDVKNDVELLNNNQRRCRLIFGNTDEEEVGHIYQFLDYISKYDFSVHRLVFMNYTSSSKLNDGIKAFNEKIVLVLVNHIKSYIINIGFQNGYFSSQNVITEENDCSKNIYVGGNFNGTGFCETQTNNINIENLTLRIKEVRKVLPPELSSEDREGVEDDLDIIQDEAAKPNPNKKILGSSIRNLNTIKDKIPHAIEFAGAVASLAQFIMSML